MAEAAKKTEVKPSEIFEGLTGTQKCAILMMLIGEDEAAEIDYKITFDPNSKIFISDNLNTLLDIEGLIFVEEKIK